jgi:hypothetical protein
MGNFLHISPSFIFRVFLRFQCYFSLRILFGVSSIGVFSVLGCVFFVCVLFLILDCF